MIYYNYVKLFNPVTVVYLSIVSVNHKTQLIIKENVQTTFLRLRLSGDLCI